MAKDEVINDGINNTAHVGMPKRSRIALAQHADPDTVLISTNKKTIQVSVQEELGKTGADSMQADESTHHQIYYLRQRISERTPSLDRLKPVELPKALEDTLNLGIADPTYKSPEYAVVVFYNQQTLESFQIIRTNVDIWDLSMPVYESDSNVCNTHCCQTNTEQVECIITKFFEGGDWRGVKKFEFSREILTLNLDLERHGISL